MAKYPFESAQQIRMLETFDKAIRDGAHHAIADPNKRKLEERIERITQKATEHFSKHSPSWVSKENAKLVAEHKGHLKPTLTPRWIVQTETSPAALAQKAFANVEHRVAQRMEKINQIANRMRNGIDPDDNGGSPKRNNRMSM